MKFAAFFLLAMTPSMLAAEYSVRRVEIDGMEVVQLADAARHMEVSIAPSVGNIVYEIKANGNNILWTPYHSPAELKSSPRFSAMPFLAPWANRLEDDTYWVNGKEYALNPKLGNVRRDNHQKPIHGLVYFSPDWKLETAAADAHSAYATSRLDFWKHPELMQQFPFAHAITLTFRLANGELQVETTIDNLSTDPMPVAIGFHPYFQIDDAPRDQWKVHLPAREHLVLNSLMLPTGERKPTEFADPFSLRGVPLDDVFTGLVRGADGRAQFWVEGKKQRIAVTYGPKYQVAVVYAPPGRDFICFEPMAAVTNAFNLAHSGLYKELQSIPPGSQWKESFWIAATGF